MQRYTVYFIWKLIYMFRVVPPPLQKFRYLVLTGQFSDNKTGLQIVVSTQFICVYKC